MVPGARGTAASEVVRAEASVGAEAWVLGESGAAKEESGAASAGSETTSPARNAIGSPSLRHLRPNAGPRHHPLPSRPRSPGCHGSGRLSPQRSAATAPGQCRPLAPVPPGTMVTSTCLHLVGHISPSWSRWRARRSAAPRRYRPRHRGRPTRGAAQVRGREGSHIGLGGAGLEDGADSLVGHAPDNHPPRSG